jgi:hypothetical protein
MVSPIRAVPNIVNANLEIDGDKVLIKNLELTDPDLVKYLLSKEGPEQVLLFIDLIETAMQIQKMANASADVKELNSVAKQIRETMKTAGDEAFTELQRIIQDQGKDEHPNSLITLLKTRLVNQVIAELDPSKESSPFHAISNQLVQLLEKNAKEEGAKESYGNSREKGLDFEALLDQMIQKEAAVHGDDALFTGDTPSPSGDKTGDEVVTINPSLTNGNILNIVWEAKTDKSFKDSKGRLKRDKVAAELEAAMTNREAEVGIFVSDARGVDLDLQPAWQEFEGNKLIIVLDDEDPDQRVVRMAYLWSRWVILREQSDSDGDSGFDFVAMGRVISALQREFDGLANLKRLHTPIQKNIVAAQEWVEEFEANLDELIEELRGLMEKGSYE